MSEEKDESRPREAFRLLWGIVARPRSTMERLSESGGRAWWLPAILAVVMLVLPILVAAPITARQTREAILATQEQMKEQWGETMPGQDEAQIEEAMAAASSPLITVVFPSLGGVVGLAVGWLIWAGALHLASMALGGRPSFGTMLRMVVWSWIPYAVRGLLQTVYILATGQLIANPGLSGLVADNRPVSEMVLAPPSTGQILLQALLSRIDIFLLWNLALLVIGVMVTARLPRRRAVLITLGVWAVLTALAMVPALIGAIFAQQAAFGPAP
ncbi:MAG TPA: YIP1 family protein [Chloroflexi bacterium]|nr:YIP1 family protein [Chloroflexota bacterium]